MDLTAKFGCATFSVKILKIAWVMLLCPPYCQSVSNENYLSYMKRTYLEQIYFGKFVLFYLFTVHRFTKFFKINVLSLSFYSKISNMKKQKINIWTTFNLRQNICRLFHFLAQFVFTTSERELDYYHEKVHVGVASQVAERLKT